MTAYVVTTLDDVNVVINGDPLATDGGTVHLINTHTYTGTTTVREGILVLGDKDAVGAPLGHIDNSDVTVEDGGRLAGNGSTGAVLVLDGGALAPGESTGIITVTDLTLVSGAEFKIEIDGPVPGPSGFDQVIVDDKGNGDVDLGGASLRVLVTGPIAFGESFKIIDNDGTADPVKGTFKNLPDESNFVSDDGRTFSIDYNGGDGNDVVLTLVGISIVKKTNGTDNNTPPGPSLPVGSTATFTYEVTNTTGSEANDALPLANVVVTDDNGTPGNTADDFNPTFTSGDDGDGILEDGETWIYTATHTVTLGQYTNTAKVTAEFAPRTDVVTVLQAEGPVLSDTDPDNHIGFIPGAEGCQIFFFGTSGRDNLTGDECDNIMLGFAGDDKLAGADGNDTLLGAGGHDVLNGNNGNDRLFGDAGTDILQGQNGDDYLDGGADQDLLLGQAGNDRLLGRGGNDRLDGGDGNDQIFGGDGNDYMLGRAGNDRLEGGNGNDRGIAGDGNDLLLGNAGNDRLDGGNGNDRLFGGDDFDILHGGTGQDYLDGGRGNDRLFGDNGNDVLLGRNGNDRLEGGRGVDQLYGGLDLDTFVFNNTNETGVTTATADRIHDFNFADGDRIRLSAIDADETVAGDQAFDFIGTAAFTAAGQIRFFTTGSETRILLNTDSDSAAEAMIRVDGVHTPVDGWFLK
jgi:autotransporter-associated beta strand protein